MWNPEESSCTPEATIGLNRGQLIAHRTASGQEIPQPEVPTELYYSTPLLNSTTQLPRTPQSLITFYTSLLQTRSYSTDQLG
jgi:hypothetical protein